MRREPGSRGDRPPGSFFTAGRAVERMEVVGERRERLWDGGLMPVDDQRRHGLGMGWVWIGYGLGMSQACSGEDAAAEWERCETCRRLRGGAAGAVCGKAGPIGRI
ncbi:Uncharacterised protein [Anaerotruncus sp. 2789STDY5834896]|uniref:Uncharacterized protein n=1 Tax=uncultured Anaerotruncus sp. TaxID=905011 RepID=A0A1C6GAT0_9FIRM|nr:Uncharacterised protein [uncultured Anaerotruncus sp.]